MKTVTFLKEPGYTYDLLSMFSLYFNKEYYISQMTIYNKIAEDTEYYNRLLDEFGKIPEELRVFFYVHKGQTPFLPEYYYIMQSDRFIGSYCFEKVMEELSSYDTVTENMIRFYFPELSEQEIAEGKDSLAKIDKWIRMSPYEDRLKAALYTFFISPMATINLLIRELMTKELWLSKYYQIHVQKQLNLKKTYDFDLLSESLKAMPNQSVELNEYSNCIVSFCLCNKNCVIIEHCEDCALILLGTDYNNCLRTISHQRRAINLDAFGSAISEKNRVDILNFMRDRGEITIKDIEQEFGFTGTNSYYHLQMMIKAGMLNTRKKGRTVFYSINDQFFDVLCDVLKGYSKTERGEQL